MHPLKKLGLLFVLLALLAGAIPAQGESVTGYAAENTVNLYGKNSASASVVATVSYGESLTCLAAKDGWVLVEYSDEEYAYCRASDLTKKDPNVYSLTVYAQEDAVAYARPVKGGKSLALTAGTTLTLVAVTPDEKWCRVEKSGVNAYVPISALSKDKTPEEPAKTAEAYSADTLVRLWEKSGGAGGTAGYLGYGEKVTCSALENGWAYVKGVSAAGWCKAASLDTENPCSRSATLAVGEDGARAYALPSASARGIASLKAGTALKCVGITPDGKWCRVTAGGKYGYVRKSDMTTSTKVDKVIALALEQLDKPYVYATRGPASFDCAGLTLYCYQKVCGISLGRSAQSQGYNEKYPKIETISQLLPGDLVFFNTEPEDDDLTDHVGIYLGNGRFVHASSSGKKVMISSLSSGFYKKSFSWGRRLIP